MSGARFTVTACVLLRQGDRWLLSIRSADAAYAPNALGLIGGHLELADAAADALEAAARREVLEETGLDLAATSLRYVRSELFDAGEGVPQVTVTFMADLAAEAEPAVTSAELAEVGWWTRVGLDADPRCPAWLLTLIDQAAALG